MQLGIIPNWQFNADPGINIKLNPHVQFPAGMNQMTVQPVVGPIDQWPSTLSFRTWPDGRLVNGQQLNGVFDVGFFDSWWWRNRKWLLLGGLTLAGVGVVSLLR